VLLLDRVLCVRLPGCLSEITDWSLANRILRHPARLIVASPVTSFSLVVFLQAHRDNRLAYE
jgi:hypothetical protein